VNYTFRIKYVFYIECEKLYVLFIDQLIKWPFHDGTQRHNSRNCTALW